MLHQIERHSITDSNVSLRLQKWFNLDAKKNVNETRILNPKTQRNLIEQEMGFFNFDFDFNFFSNPILIGKRLQVKNVIYHSEDYNRVGKNRCNYAIRFKGESLVNYGVIKYFLLVNEGIFIALNELIIKSSIADGFRGRGSNVLNELKRTGILNLFFCFAEKSEKIIIISKDKIISKCVIQELNDGKFNISEFPVENDYN
jgi:hypothetical protein